MDTSTRNKLIETITKWRQEILKLAEEKKLGAIEVYQKCVDDIKKILNSKKGKN